MVEAQRGVIVQARSQADARNRQIDPFRSFNRNAYIGRSRTKRPFELGFTFGSFQSLGLICLYAVIPRILRICSPLIFMILWVYEWAVS
jgi:hypothetical protein